MSKYLSLFVSLTFVLFTMSCTQKGPTTGSLDEQLKKVETAQVPSGGTSSELPPGHPPVAEGEAAQGAAPMGGMMGAPSAPEVTVAAGSVTKAAGGYTVEECFSKKQELKGKSVSVRGRVVKVNRGIMGKNWIHLRDGTGTEGKNDLTVMTTEDAKPGDLLLAKGSLVYDKDIGAGYKYAVIMEEAKLSLEK